MLLRSSFLPYPCFERIPDFGPRYRVQHGIHTGFRELLKNAYFLADRNEPSTKQQVEAWEAVGVQDPQVRGCVFFASAFPVGILGSRARARCSV